MLHQTNAIRVPGMPARHRGTWTLTHRARAARTAAPQTRRGGGDGRRMRLDGWTLMGQGRGEVLDPPRST